MFQRREFTISSLTPVKHKYYNKRKQMTGVYDIGDPGWFGPRWDTPMNRMNTK